MNPRCIGTATVRLYVRTRYPGPSSTVRSNTRAILWAMPTVGCFRPCDFPEEVVGHPEQATQRDAFVAKLVDAIAMLPQVAAGPSLPAIGVSSLLWYTPVATVVNRENHD